ncbi:GDSL-type esterase/lipase family protein [Cryptosporangium aurantiacum]|uniref:GDSL-like Lipase/Acylhydrolase family protein n=1 Tax=Cryptosporangium aurantiacum TaxID=134849 RepID=A0A1M7IJP8_9ACTN|nr:GDSL-type esterase/lipase family protein [Cryptosporangium aurantiacum]SHM40899.1 GDSL-like Lipase/Acylhydrolase family protein [Cryptosporangium aurantiacum]
MAAWRVLTAVALVLSGLLFTNPADAAARRPAIVGMGDSLVAGEGAGRYLPATDRRGNFCHRSRAAALQQTTLPGVADPARVNLACAGATTANVRLGGNPRYGEAPQAEQLRTVARRYDVRLIVLTVGVNDVGYANLAYDCILAYLRLADRCQDTWAPRIRQRLAAAVPRISQDVRDIRSVLREAGYRSDDYTLVLQSYASPVTGDIRYGTAARGLFGCPVRDDDGNWAKNWVAAQFSAAFARIAADEGVRFLDLAPALRGREACARGISRFQEWSRGVTVDLAAIRHGLGMNVLQQSAHPNARGHAQFARCLSAFVARGDRAAKCARQSDGNLAPVAAPLAA